MLIKFIFSGEVLKFIQAQIGFFAVSLLIYSIVQVFSFAIRKANFAIEQQKCKSEQQKVRKIYRLLVSTVDFVFQISLWIKKINY